MEDDQVQCVRRAIRRAVRHGSEDKSDLDASVAPLLSRDPTFLRYLLRNMDFAERLDLLDTAAEINLYVARLQMVDGRPPIPPTERRCGAKGAEGTPSVAKVSGRPVIPPTERRCGAKVDGGGACDPRSKTPSTGCDSLIPKESARHLTQGPPRVTSPQETIPLRADLLRMLGVVSSE